MPFRRKLELMRNVSRFIFLRLSIVGLVFSGISNLVKKLESFRQTIH